MAEIQNEDLAGALAQFSMLRYFPADEMAHESIVMLLRRLCGTREQLQWLVAQMVDRVGYWPGPAELRGLLCSRFRPADGIEADCTLPGYRACDGEIASQQQEPPRLAPGEAVKLIEGLKDPQFERDFLERQIDRQKKRLRENIGNTEVVRTCLERIREHKEQIKAINLEATAA